MLYKPNYCCHCGEKIERVDWSFTASRRFCEVCQSDFVGHEWLPTIFVGLMAIVGVFGFGSYLASGEKILQVSTKSALASPSSLRKDDPASASANKNSNNQQPTEANNVLTNKPASSAATKAPVEAPPEATYFCGAPTKKGNPCSRRVKGGGRCWQHKGQTAMLPPDELLAN